MRFRYLNRIEKILVIFLMITFFISVISIGHKFIRSFSESTASIGGVYSEGMVGQIQFLNPVFADLNPVDRDISSLIFSGLMRYNSETDSLEDDIALHTLDTTKTVYTFTLRDDVYWHDGEKVTADDILFTYQEVIQNVDFKNSLLRENLKGVGVKKINDTTVTFSLTKPYKFFLTNLTVGLLPKHILAGVPVENLDLSEFNTFNPVGTGPYKVITIDGTNGVERVSLERNDEFYGEKPFIKNVDFYIYPNFEQLELSKAILDGVQSLTKDTKDIFSAKSLFRVEEYSLPQYVAAFLNMESPLLQDKRVRLGLALGTNKTVILDDIKEMYEVDTPFLELNSSNWLLQHDTTKAQGSLNDAGWKLPWKQEINLDDLASEIKVLEEDPEFITEPNAGKNYVAESGSFFLEGTTKEGTQQVFVNGYKLNLFKPSKGTFTYKVDLGIGTLKEGMNEYVVEVADSSGTKEVLDSIKIYYSPDLQSQELQQEAFEKEDQEVLKSLQALKDQQIELIKERQDQPFRINSKGESLAVRIVTSQYPKEYGEVASLLKDQWEKIGVDAQLEILPIQELQQRFETRDYDVLIFGQSLGYNFDSYPYWHSSQASTGFNFSQLKSFEIDTLLEEIRSTHKVEVRQKSLKILEEKLVAEMPAIFLYAPEKYFAIGNRIQGAEFSNLRNARDRFSDIAQWFIHEEYTVIKDLNILDFFQWYFRELGMLKPENKEISENE